MLKSMRNNFKSYSWTLWLVILAFVGGFIFFSGIGGNEQMTEDAVVTIGSQEVPDVEFQQYLVRTLDSYRRQFKGNFSRSLIQQMQIPERALQDLVNSSVIRQECDRLGLTVSDRELAEAIRGDARFQQDGRFIGTAEYERLLALNQIQTKDFESELRQSLLADKLRDLVSAGAMVDWKALREDFRKENDKADVEYVAFRVADVKEAPEVSDADLAAYHQAHADRFRSEETRSGQALLFKLNDFRPQLKIGEKDLYDQFMANKDQYRVPGKTRVSRISLKYSDETREQVLQKATELARTLTADNFAQRAQELSEDDKAKQGGDWGYFAWRDFTAPEQTIIDKLDLNAVSSPVDAGGAFSLLRVTERVADRQETFDEVKARIRTMLENDKLRQLAGERMARTHAKVKDAKDLRVAAAGQKLQTVALTSLSNGQGVPKIDDMGYLSRRLFELQPGQVSAPAEMPDAVFIVQLQKVTAPQGQPLAAVRDRVREEVVRSRKLDALQDRAQAMAATLNAQADAKALETLLSREKLKLETTEYRRGDRLAEFAMAGLDDRIFAMEPGRFSVPIRFTEAVALVRLKARTLSGDAEFAAAKQKAYQDKLESEQNSRFSAYIMEQRDRYQIRFNSERFNKVKEYATSRFH